MFEINEGIANAWWFIAIGYVVFLVYTVGIMALGEVIENKTKIDKTVCRKLTHIISALVWVICWFFFGCSFHWVLLNGLGTVALGVVVFGNKMKAYERDDAKKSYGLFFFGLVTFVVACITFTVYMLAGEEIGLKLYYFAGIAYYCLALGDGLAPIVVKLFKKHNLELCENRSLVGTLTVFIVSFLTVWEFTAIFNIKMDLLFMVSVASLTCIAEFYGVKGIDNILIDLLVFGYLVLYAFNLVGTVFTVVIAISPVLTCLVYLSKSLSFTGGLSTVVMFYTIGYVSGEDFTPIVFVTVMFLLASAFAIVSKKVKERREGKENEKHTRTGVQVMAVGLVATLSLIAYFITKFTVFNLLYYVCITEQFADSVASDIGCLTKGKNLNIIGFKPVEKGISGGVSVLGTILALVSSFMLMVIPFAIRIAQMSTLCYVLASIIAFVGSVMDSVLGSLFQALYKCRVCGTHTESDCHCGEEAELVKGFPIIKNVTVNFLTSVFTFALGFVLVLVL